MCPDHPHERHVRGALRAESAHRGGDRTGLRSRSDHDAGLRRRQHLDGRVYVVTAAGNTTKPPQHYVQETWTDSGGHPYFTFAPINACSGCSGQIYLLEQISGSIKQSDLGPTHQVVLVYDDTEPFQTFTPMPYCLQDPREPGNTLLETGVLPSGATSCIVEAHQRRSATVRS